ncbi:MAG: hypothetical protein Q9M91_08330 [Candidatus Dojkabacteria bacterium]|nr:hypothetical protein [Candidatus Dojkabacteria bacterium]MDQ7021781.1 hypothetical protein [Candidatus Dojkabacteria bacterium]
MIIGNEEVFLSASQFQGQVLLGSNLNGWGSDRQLVFRSINEDGTIKNFNIDLPIHRVSNTAFYENQLITLARLNEDNSYIIRRSIFEEGELIQLPPLSLQLDSRYQNINLYTQSLTVQQSDVFRIFEVVIQDDNSDALLRPLDIEVPAIYNMSD